MHDAWRSSLSPDRWFGRRHQRRGTAAFSSLENFQTAVLNEFHHSFTLAERKALHALLRQGDKKEVENFLSLHGANPLFDPEKPLSVEVGIPESDRVNLAHPPHPDALQAVLNGAVVHLLFQAGEASRFHRGPFYNLNIYQVARQFPAVPDVRAYLDEIEKKRKTLSPEVGSFLIEGELGPKQCLMARAAVRRIVQESVDRGDIKPADALERYRGALARQKFLFFIGKKESICQDHRRFLHEQFDYFGFSKENLVTVGQELANGLEINEKGEGNLLDASWSKDAAGHLYALLQAVRPGGFFTFGPDGELQSLSSDNAFDYFARRGGEILNIIRINDMDRHSTEIINPKAVAYAMGMFNKGYVNLIEAVSNPGGQKGGTGITLDDPQIHVLTETHENSFPCLSRKMDKAMTAYLKKSGGRHPPYNAMRQIADLKETKNILEKFGARIVFVPRQKEVGGKKVTYLGIDMPMGDLSLLQKSYPSRLFQFVDPGGRELCIHDMKTVENIPVALRAILNQLKDPFVTAAAREVFHKELFPFAPPQKMRPVVFGAAAPEFLP